MKYAVLDWDNTVRKKFTLFSWMNYLYDEEVINRTVVGQQIKDTQNQYADGVINHDEYAEKACAIYARAMKGITLKERDKLLAEYMKYDRKDIFPLSRAVFKFLYQNNILPVIISGAPQYIVEEYKEEFHLAEVYAFAEAYEKRICTGKVEFNYGANKMRTVEKLIHKYGGNPIMGFGDSYSDIPLFDMSDLAFCIVEEGSDDRAFGTDVNYVSNNISEAGMMRLLRGFVEHM